MVNPFSFNHGLAHPTYTGCNKIAINECTVHLTYVANENWPHMRDGLTSGWNNILNDFGLHPIIITNYNSYIAYLWTIIIWVIYLGFVGLMSRLYCKCSYMLLFFHECEPLACGMFDECWSVHYEHGGGARKWKSARYGHRK